MNKPFFGPRRGSVGACGLPDATPGYANLPGSYDTAALLAALAAARGQAQVTPEMTQAMARQMQAAQPQRARRTLLGLTKVAVAGGATATSTTAIQGGSTGGPFRGLRLIVPSDISASGDLINLTVGSAPQIALSQGATASGIPLRVFDQTSQDSGFIDMDWSTPGGGSEINITVQNKFAAPFPFFEGALEGLQLVA